MGVQQGMSRTAATHRLLRDLRAVLADPLPTISAEPLEDDIFEWHCNMRPNSGPYQGVTFHFVLRFPTDYPNSPPEVEMCSFLKHPNLFHGWGGRNPYICLDLLRRIDGDSHADGGYNGGWSTAYTAQSVLVQLQSFLFEENAIPQEEQGVKAVDMFGTYYGSKGKGKDSNQHHIDRAKRDAKDFHCPKCGHSGRYPRPTVCPTAAPAVPMVRHHLSHNVSGWKLCEDGWEERDEGNGMVTRRKNVDGAVRIELKHGSISGHKQQSDTARAITALTASTRSAPTDETACEVVSASAKQITELDELDLLFKSKKKKKRKNKNTAPQKAASDCAFVRGLQVALPDELMLEVMDMLDTKSVYHLLQTCRGLAAMVTRTSALVYRDLLCFHTKATLREDILGVGVTVSEHQKASCRTIEAPLDLLSLSAFERGVRLSAWKERFQHYLPVMLDRQHQEMVGQRLERAIVNIHRCGHRPGRCQDLFTPSMCLDVLPKLMNSAVVRLMKAENGGKMQQHTSDAALSAYCAYHHILLALAERHPSLCDLAEEKVQRFIQAADTDRRGDLKSVCPNLGELLVMLTISHTSWEELAPYFVVETMTRNVKWMLEAHPELYYLEDFESKYRVRTTLDASRTSQRLVMFQVYFLRTIGRPMPWQDVLARYNLTFGRPPTKVFRALHTTCKQILQIKSSAEYFDRLGVSPPTDLCGVMRAAVRNSAWAGYHRRWHYDSRFSTWDSLTKCRGEPELWDESSIRDDKMAEGRWMRSMLREKRNGPGAEWRRKMALEKLELERAEQLKAKKKAEKKMGLNPGKGRESRNLFAVLAAEDDEEDGMERSTSSPAA